ncbi:MAG: 16S rRNA (cytidine(1402)-2'-O)-methyltransferase [Actinobacteria bacterium]|nr:16S rRNA (cytidine(1402)-2'-O)-methyltransferase [Actinomycetota bacterium]
MKSGKLILAGAPLGNPEDASIRLRQALTQAKIIFAEDTRRLRHLAQDLQIDITGELRSFFAGNERERLGELRTLLDAGESILLITDGGMPGISDPGYLAIQTALECKADIEVLPGPSAVTTALVLSGLPMERFLFDGFTPRTSNARRDYIDSIKNQPRTIVIFEAPHRTKELIGDLLEILGERRQVALCREMTKKYQEVFRGSLEDLSQWATEREILGEVTIVIAGATPEEITSRAPDQIARLVGERERAGMERREAVAAVAQELNLRKREVFDALVATKMEQ